MTSLTDWIAAYKARDAQEKQERLVKALAEAVNDPSFEVLPRTYDAERNEIHLDLPGHHRITFRPYGPGGTRIHVFDVTTQCGTIVTSRFIDALLAAEQPKAAKGP